MSLASVDPNPVHDDLPPGAALRALLDRQRAAFAAEPYPPLEVRRARLEKLAAVLQDRRADILRAVSADFGHRSPNESLLTEVFLPVSAIRYILRHLKAWMRPESRGSTLALKPASNRVVAQPLGVVGIISPWNYPVHLGVIPLAYALAAGNRAMIKPSELTPRTSDLLAELLGSQFGEDLVAVVRGDAQVGAAFAELPFDHLLFTGSTAVGRLVMQAAAKNLVPVTLELGGKSPAVVHPEYPLEVAAERIAAGKLFNAGQTCVAPDYVLVDRRRADPLCAEIVRAVGKLYPRLVDNPDYTAVINERHRARLQGLLDDARDRGAELVEINPAGESFADAGTKMAPVLVRRATDDMRVMQDEIFGPVLPVVEVDGVDEALRYVTTHPRPLAMYYFDNDGARVERVLQTTHAGGVTVNDCMLHVAEEHLPFGGVGPSGMGAYHGKEGFDALSHRKAVLRQSRLTARSLILPPYGTRLERLLDWLM